MVNLLATRLPTLEAAVPFYGPGRRPPTTSPTIKAPLMLHFADNDDRVNTGLAGVRGGAQGGRREVRGASYPGTQHGFNNDTTPRYDAAAAEQAWQPTINFFNQRLRG